MANNFAGWTKCLFIWEFTKLTLSTRCMTAAGSVTNLSSGNNFNTASSTAVDSWPSAWTTWKMGHLSVKELVAIIPHDNIIPKNAINTYHVYPQIGKGSWHLQYIIHLHVLFESRWDQIELHEISLWRMTINHWLIQNKIKREGSSNVLWASHTHASNSVQQISWHDWRNPFQHHMAVWLQVKRNLFLGDTICWWCWCWPWSPSLYQSLSIAISVNKRLRLVSSSQQFTRDTASWAQHESDKEWPDEIDTKRVGFSECIQKRTWVLQERHVAIDGSDSGSESDVLI